MADSGEKRGPVEKTASGWPINPIGVFALLVFGLVIVFLIAKPLFEQKSTGSLQDQNSNAAGGRITSPASGEVVSTPRMQIEISVDRPTNTEKVQFWVKTYADGKWQMIGEVSQAPYQFAWDIPDSMRNKAIALTSHIFTKDGEDIKDPGGWREGIIILEQ